MQDDPTHGAHDLHTDGDERLPQARHLHTAERSPFRAELDLLEEDEGRGRQGDAQLIGPEARTTGASEGERMFELLQPIFTVAANAIHLGVDPFGRLAQSGDDEARVIARFAPVVPHDFGLDNRAPGRVPCAGLIGRLRVRRRKEKATTFRTWGYPWAPALFCLVSFAIVANTIVQAPGPAFAGLGVMAAGIPLYWWMRSRSLRTGAHQG
jgi:hypothetical protein